METLLVIVLLAGIVYYVVSMKKQNSEALIGKFSFNLEKEEGKGEDGDPILLLIKNKGVLGVFDGLGAAGGAFYSLRNSRVTGAYFASRATKEIVEQYFQNMLSQNFVINANEIAQKITSELKTKAKDPDLKALSSVKGRLFKTFPTTVALLVFEILTSSIIQLSVLWAGDSRCYCLSPEIGLQQLTKDDLIEYGDALQNSRNDSKISNFVNLDQPFNLNIKSLEIGTPIILFAATDGAYGYLKTPMYFEYVLIHTLFESSCFGDWSDSLKEYLGSVAGDDISISLVAIGFNGIDNIKKSFVKRYQLLLNEYIKPLEEIRELQSKDNMKDATETERKKIDDLWSLYKSKYEELL